MKRLTTSIRRRPQAAGCVEIESDYPTLARLGSLAGAFFGIREVLADLYPCSDAQTRELVREHLLHQLPVKDGMAARHYSHLLRVINPEEWSPGDITKITKTRAECDHNFRHTIESIFLDHDVETREDLKIAYKPETSQHIFQLAPMSHFRRSLFKE